MKKITITSVKKTLWEECRKFAKAKYVKDGGHFCFTCSKPIEKANCQLGHFIPSSVGGALLRYHPENLKLQCYYCNINLGGNGSEFYRRLVVESGQEYVDKLFRIKNKTVKADITFHLKLLSLYTMGDEKSIVQFLEGGI